jgi:hypothetical protein
VFQGTAIRKGGKPLSSKTVAETAHAAPSNQPKKGTACRRIWSLYHLVAYLSRLISHFCVKFKRNLQIFAQNLAWKALSASKLHKMQVKLAKPAEWEGGIGVEDAWAIGAHQNRRVDRSKPLRR